jgi:hypothetical protein
VSAAEQVLHRRWDKLHEDADPDKEGYLPGDGLRLWVSRVDLTPDDDFLQPPAAAYQPDD